MNFNLSEKIREDLQKQTALLKTFQVHKKQKQFTQIIKNHADCLEELFNEIKELREEFQQFKLNTLSKMEEDEKQPGRNRMITTPFDIYSSQK